VVYQQGNVPAIMPQYAWKSSTKLAVPFTARR
jgi:hypothetical protein